MIKRLLPVLFLLFCSSCTSNSKEDGLVSASLKNGFKWQKLVSKDESISMSFEGGKKNIGVCHCVYEDIDYRGLVYFSYANGVGHFTLRFDNLKKIQMKIIKIHKSTLSIENLENGNIIEFSSYKIAEKDIDASNILVNSLVPPNATNFHIRLFDTNVSGYSKSIYYCAYKGSLTFLTFDGTNSFIFERDGIYSKGSLSAYYDHIDLYFNDDNIFQNKFAMQLIYSSSYYSSSILLEELNPSTHQII